MIICLWPSFHAGLSNVLVMLWLINIRQFASCKEEFIINVIRIFDTADLSSRASLGPSPMNKLLEAFECFN